MGLRYRAWDPRSGRERWFTAYERNGRVVIQRLPDHLFRDGLTPARLEAMANFAEAASTGFGQLQTTELPPAAESVRRALTGRPSAAEGGPRPIRFQCLELPLEDDSSA